VRVTICKCYSSFYTLNNCAITRTWKPWSIRKDNCSSLISNIRHPHSPKYCIAQTVDCKPTSRRWWLAPPKFEQSHVSGYSWHQCPLMCKLGSLFLGIFHQFQKTISELYSISIICWMMSYACLKVTISTPSQQKGNRVFHAKLQFANQITLGKWSEFMKFFASCDTFYERTDRHYIKVLEQEVYKRILSADGWHKAYIYTWCNIKHTRQFSIQIGPEKCP